MRMRQNKDYQVEIFRTGVYAPVGASIKTKVRCLVDAGWHRVELKRIYEYEEIRGMLAINTEIRGMLAINTKEFNRLIDLCEEAMPTEDYAPFMVDFFSDDADALNKIFVFKEEKMATWLRIVAK